MRDSNASQGFNPPREHLDNEWGEHESYWRQNWHTRPYADADRDFDYYRPAYRYGYDAAHNNRIRDWEELHPQLQSGWGTQEYSGKTTWDSVKDAVEDGWRRALERINQS